MRRIGSSPLAFPDFRGATRQLILINLGTYFALMGGLFGGNVSVLAGLIAFDPSTFCTGCSGSPLRTASCITAFGHALRAAFAVVPGRISREPFITRTGSLGLYGVSVLGTAAAALVHLCG